MELLQEFQVYVLGFFALLCMLLYLQDLLLGFIKKNSSSYLISFIISVSVMACDYFIPQTKDAWFINDIIAVAVAGAFIKFIIIYKLKGSIFGLVVLWVFCLFRECVQFMTFLHF
jgi:hypothetical protein